MPRDSNGLYVLPGSNPVADGAIIQASWANGTMSDIAVQMNNVLTRDGLLGPVNPLLLINGTSNIPSLAFSTQPGLGLFRDGVNAISVTAGGIIPIKFADTAVDVFKPLGIADGTAALPSLRFTVLQTQVYT